jgi:hypothetical protein
VKLCWRQLTADLAGLGAVLIRDPYPADALVANRLIWTSIKTRVQIVLLCEEIENATRTKSRFGDPQPLHVRDRPRPPPLWPVDRLNVARHEKEKEEERMPLGADQQAGPPNQRAGE